MSAVLVLDGSWGEGGGQILRTALSISAITKTPIRIERIRAGRQNPGLAAQHLTAVRSVAALCGARLTGDALRSQRLEFVPSHAVQAGHHVVDVADARPGGSAGALSLVLQAMLLPLALAPAPSTVVLAGGTHAHFSPPFEYVTDIWLPALAKMGVVAHAELVRWGWHPIGRGEARVTIQGAVRDIAPLICTDRGALRRVFGRAVTSHLPDHVGKRMVQRATDVLAASGIDSEIRSENVDAIGPGGAIFLVAEYANARAGFGALAARGKPAETVAEEAVRLLLDHHGSRAALDVHLADQILLSAAFASGTSRFTCERITGHLATNGWVIEQFGLARIETESRTGLATVSIHPSAQSLHDVEKVAATPRDK